MSCDQYLIISEAEIAIKSGLLIASRDEYGVFWNRNATGSSFVDIIIIIITIHGVGVGLQ